jgi:acetyl-CoA acetyltransferase
VGAQDARFPWDRVAIVGVHNTKQARYLEGETAKSLTLAAALGALDDAGLTPQDVDGVTGGPLSTDLVYELGAGPAWVGGNSLPIVTLFEAAAAVAAGLAEVVVVAGAEAGVYTDRAATAPWTRPANEFVAPWGLFTAAEFALIARVHMDRFGTTSAQMARVAATIRNNGTINPEAVYYGRGPFTIEDILASRMVADPFHLLDCSMTSEGGCALVLTTVERARDLRQRPVFILGAAHDSFGPAYQYPPAFDLTGTDGFVNGRVGERAARLCFGHAGLTPNDVDVLELYDPFSFEIIRQLEAYGFCGPGEGGPFVEDGNVEPDGRFPLNTDGGLMSYSHAGAMPQMMQRVIRGVLQVQGRCATRQIDGAEVAMCSNGGAGALFTSVMLLGASSS